MTSVWVVQAVDYESSVLYGVFSSEELAEEFAKLHKIRAGELEITEEVIDQGDQCERYCGWVFGKPVRPDAWGVENK